MSRPRNNLRFDDALQFAMEVNDTLKYKRGKFAEFLKILNDFKAIRNDLEYVKERVMEQFKEHVKLLLGINAFMPPGHGIPLPSNDEQQSDNEESGINMWCHRNTFTIRISETRLEEGVNVFTWKQLL
ncbi:unnamed protein product [Lathyrus oleraceus]